MNRRELIIAALGLGIGGSLATGTGLGYYYYRRSQRQVNVRQVRRKASDSAVDNWLLTDADHAALAERNDLPSSDAIQILENVDIPGAGDLRSERVANVSECVAACEADDQCNAFTFARISHPETEKRHMCWIKGQENPERQLMNIHYISGIK
ncbi:MAG: PAN domain-containing protein [Pseudomonadota bacterium]